MPNISPVDSYKIIEMGDGLKAPFYIIPFNEAGQCKAALTNDQMEQDQLIIEDIAVSLDPHSRERFYTLTKSNQYLHLNEALELAKILAPFYDRTDGEIPEKASVPSPELLVEMWRATLTRN